MATAMTCKLRLHHVGIGIALFFLYTAFTFVTMVTIVTTTNNETTVQDVSLSNITT